MEILCKMEIILNTMQQMAGTPLKTYASIYKNKKKDQYLVKH